MKSNFRRSRYLRSMCVRLPALTVFLQVYKGTESQTRYMPTYYAPQHFLLSTSLHKGHTTSCSVSKQILGFPRDNCLPSHCMAAHVQYGRMSKTCTRDTNEVSWEAQILHNTPPLYGDLSNMKGAEGPYFKITTTPYKSAFCCFCSAALIDSTQKKYKVASPE